MNSLAWTMLGACGLAFCCVMLGKFMANTGAPAIERYMMRRIAKKAAKKFLQQKA
jgi:hypothetical protein